MTTKEFISKSDAVLTAEREAFGRLISWTLSGFGVGVVVFTIFRLDPHKDGLAFIMFWFLGTPLHALLKVESGRTPAALFSLKLNLAVSLFATVVAALTLHPPGVDLWSSGIIFLFIAVLYVPMAIPCLTYMRKDQTAGGEFELRCPGCHADLIRMRTVVIASRHCGCCGASVLEKTLLPLDAPVEQAPNALLMTIDSARRKQRVVFYLSMAISVINVYLLISLAQTNYVVPISSDGKSPGFKIGPSVPIAGIASSSYMTVSLDSTFAENGQPYHAERTHFGVVAQQVVQVMETLFQGRMLSDRRPIVISQKEQPSHFAVADVKSDPQRITVYFDTDFSEEMIREKSYASFAFLLSNALAQVAVKPRPEDAVEDALVETLSVAVALETCDRLTDVYPQWNLPQEWQEYGANYKALGNRLVQRLLERIPAGPAEAVRQKQWSKLTRYLMKYRQSADAKRGIEERWNSVLLGATVLRSQPVPWPELVNFAARTSIDPRAISPDLHKALARIGRAPGTRPKTASKKEDR